MVAAAETSRSISNSQSADPRKASIGAEPNSIIIFRPKWLLTATWAVSGLGTKVVAPLTPTRSVPFSSRNVIGKFFFALEKLLKISKFSAFSALAPPQRPPLPQIGGASLFLVRRCQNLVNTLEKEPAASRADCHFSSLRPRPNRL